MIYRPPSSGRNSKSFNLFSETIRELLERVSFQKTRFVTLSDLTSHCSNVNDKNACDLRATIYDVTSATHCRDNILDPVLTPVTGSVMTDVSVASWLTDHHIISCKLTTDKPRPVRKEIFTR